MAGCKITDQHRIDQVANDVKTGIEANPQIIQTLITLWPDATYYIGGVLAFIAGWQKWRRATETKDLKKALVDSNTPGPIGEHTRKILTDNGVVEPVGVGVPKAS